MWYYYCVLIATQQTQQKKSAIYDDVFSAFFIKTANLAYCVKLLL